MTRQKGCSKGPSVLVIGPTPPPYHGLALFTKLVLTYLPSKGYQTRHIDTRRPLGTGGQLKVGTIARDLGFVARVAKNLVVSRPQLTYMPMSQTALGAIRDWVVVSLCTAFGSRTVLHLHGSYFRKLYEDSPRCIKQLMEATLRRTSAVIVLGDSLRCLFAGLVREDSIYVVPNGLPREVVSDERIEKIREERYSCSRERLRVLYLSNLSEAKGYLDLIRAVAVCNQKGIEVEAILAGAWLDRSRSTAEKLISNAELHQRIRFAGVVSGEEKDRLLSDSDVFVLPSYNEGLPLSIIEAMAFGLPVISSRTGCIAEVVHDGRNGFLVDAGDIAALASRLELLYRCPRLRFEMGAKARELFKKQFTVDITVTRLDEVFKRVLETSKL